MTVRRERGLDVLDRIRAWVLDVDGCLMRTSRAGGAGGRAMPGAQGLVAALRLAGHAVLVCTNASQLPPHAYAHLLRAQGIDVADDMIVTGGTAAAEHVRCRHPEARVLVVGDEGVAEPLRSRGARLVPATDPDLADVVVVGAADVYPAAVTNAAALAVEQGAAFYTTVDVPWFHGGAGKSLCLSAAMSAAIAYAAGTQPQVVGKPSPLLAERLLAALGHAPNEVAVVGDALVEIELARHMGVTALLVLSGATSRDRASTLAGSTRPDLVLEDVAGLHSLLASTLSRQRSPS